LNEHRAHLSWKRTSDKAGTLSDDVLERILGGCEAFYAAAVGTPGATQIRAALDKAKALSIPDPGSGPRYRNIVLSTSNPPCITMGGWPKPKNKPWEQLRRIEQLRRELEGLRGSSPPQSKTIRPLNRRGRCLAGWRRGRPHPFP
jgi:hypothetical protein